MREFDAFKLINNSIMGETELCSFLEATPVFKDLDWESIQKLARCMQVYEAPQGASIFFEGDQGTYMCIIMRGLIEILKQDSTGENAHVTTVGPGKILGEMSLIDGEPRSATCVALQKTLLVVLTKDNFQRINQTMPGLGLKVVTKIARMLSQRLRQTSGMLVDFLEHKSV